MDINICIDRLGLNNNQYKLNQSNPPHHFIEWLGPDPQPTEAELRVAWAEYLAEKAGTEYIEKRAAEYPAIGDQLDALLKEFNYRRLNGDNLVSDLDGVIGDWLAVKAKYPKPEQP